MESPNAREDGFLSPETSHPGPTAGNGYWIWKPFIIQQELNQLAGDDILIYCDAGVEIMAALSPLVESALDNRDLLLFAGDADLTGRGLGLAVPGFPLGPV